MKKITLLITLMLSSLGFAQVPGTAAPTPPTRVATDVISIYGSAYTNIAGVNTNPNWGQGTVVTEVAIVGDNALKYANFGYQGTDWSGTPQNISGMEYLHVDVWTNNQAPNVYVISGGAEVPHAISSVAGSWQSLDIPVAGLTGNLTNAIQFKFDGGTGGTIYLDNLYFWKTPANPLKDATLSDLKVDGTTVTGFTPSAYSYTYDFVVGTTVVPQITAATTSNVGATVTTITQASGIPGSATVLVTSADASTTQTYTVSFTATKPNASPTPSTSNAEVLSVYGDTGGFTNKWNKDYAFGSFDSKPDLDASAAVNEAIKMNFAVAGYGEGTNVTTDVSAYNYVHFDYFVDPTLAAGINGDQIKFILIGGGEFNYVLTPTGADGTMVKGSWQSVSVPLSVFTGKGFSKTNFLQFKLGTDSDLNTKIAYFDNIYFSINTPTALGTTKFETSSIKLYPNPATNTLNIDANSTIDKVSIYNVLGQEVIAKSPKANNTTIDISNLQIGTYIVKTTSEGKTETTKVLKK